MHFVDEVETYFRLYSENAVWEDEEEKKEKNFWRRRIELTTKYISKARVLMNAARVVFFDVWYDNEHNDAMQQPSYGSQNTQWTHKTMNIYINTEFLEWICDLILKAFSHQCCRYGTAYATKNIRVSLFNIRK